MTDAQILDRGYRRFDEVTTHVDEVTTESLRHGGHAEVVDAAKGSSVSLCLCG